MKLSLPISAESLSKAFLATVATLAIVASGLTLTIVSTSTAQQPHQQFQTQEVVEARKFVLRDARGQMRAELGPNRAGTTIGLRLYDLRGKERISIALSNKGDLASVSLIDSHGDDRAIMIMDQSGASIAVADADRVAGITAENLSEAAFIAGKGGVESVVLGIDAAGNPITQP